MGDEKLRNFSSSVISEAIFITAFVVNIFQRDLEIPFSLLLFCNISKIYTFFLGPFSIYISVDF